MATTRSAKKPPEDKTEEIPAHSEPPTEEKLTYEQARDELIEVVNRLESGVESLADSMDLFKRGEYLASLCEGYLADARATVEEVRD